MRTLVRVTFPVERGNAAISDGSIAEVFQGFMEAMSPEAAYFYSEDGKRAALFVIDLADPSQIPMVAEPFFLKLNAQVTLTPAMNAAELEAGLASLAAAATA